MHITIHTFKESCLIYWLSATLLFTQVACEDDLCTQYKDMDQHYTVQSHDFSYSRELN